MGREEEMLRERMRKLEELRKQGVNPFSYSFDQKHHAADLLKKYEHLKPEEKSNDKVSVAGRIMTIRSFGKLSFVQLQDASGKIQIFIEAGALGEKENEFFLKHFDSGDIIGVDGIMHRTKRGEISVFAKKIIMLTKAMLPLPEKWHGLQDKEEQFRRRYLDIIMDPEVKALFVRKSKFWQTVRNFLLERGFLEVETPVLENTTGGAAATPFKTHQNALDIDVYLRISMGELWQKKLMVAGYEKTFEIGRQFRNEGMDMEHLQDYTQMEFYWAYADFNDGMKLVEEMYKKVAQEVFGSLKFKIHEHEVDLGKKWTTYDYETLIKEKTGIDMYKATAKDIIKKLAELKVEYAATNDKWKLVDVLWKFCRQSISGPGFLINQPVEVSPLAKRSRKDPRKVEQFQVIIAGSEVGNGYSELNDPVDQEERFNDQRKKKEQGDTEAHEHDKSFIESLEYGMPPTCGFGVSERLFSFLSNRPIRECVIFPLMKPGEETKEEKNLDRIVEKVVAKEEKKEVKPKIKKDGKKSKK